MKKILLNGLLTFSVILGVSPIFSQEQALKLPLPAGVNRNIYQKINQSTARFNPTANVAACGVDTILYPYLKESLFAPNDSFFVDAMIGTVRTASQAYVLSGSATVRGIQFWGAAYTPGTAVQNTTAKVYLYNVNSSYQPTTIIDSATVVISQAYGLYEAIFTTPHAVNDTFAVAVKCNVANDTIAVVTNNCGANWHTTNMNEGLTWRRFASGVWNPSLTLFQQSLEYMIFPIMNYSIDAGYTVSGNNISAGGTVNFNNTSSAILKNRMLNINVFEQVWQGQPDSTFFWNFGDSPANTVSFNASHNYNLCGAYTSLLYANNIGYYTFCEDTALSTINVNMISGISSTAVSCLGGSNGSALVTVSGGTAPYTYSWSPSGGTSSIASNLSAGNYTCTISSSNGCSATQTTSISQPSVNPTVNLGNDITTCSGSTITLNAQNSGATYTWNDNSNAQTLSVITSGTYYVTVSFSGGCTASDTILVNFNQSPSVSLNLGIDSFCVNSGLIALSGGLPAGGVFSGTGVTNNNFDASVGPGNFNITYTYTDSVNGCSASVSQSIYVDQCLSVLGLIENSVQVFPNPASDEISIQSSELVEKSTLDMFDMQGKRLKTTPLISGERNVISLIDIAEGVYSLRIISGNNSTQIRLIICR